MTHGERIKQRRIEIGISAEELADRIGKSRATVYRYENGDIEDMPITIIDPLAKALNTTPAYLMGWEVDEKIAFDAKNVRYFNKTLKHYRELNHFTETELEDKLHLPAGTINRLEDSESVPTDELLYLFADFFNISINDLLDDYRGLIFQRIKNIITHYKLTVDEFLDKLGIARDLYDNWENGISKSYIGFLDLISKTYDVPIGYLWGDYDTNIYSGDNFWNKESKYSQAEIELIKKYRLLNNVGRSEAIKRIEELAKIDTYID